MRESTQIHCCGPQHTGPIPRGERKGIQSLRAPAAPANMNGDDPVKAHGSDGHTATAGHANINGPEGRRPSLFDRIKSGLHHHKDNEDSASCETASTLSGSTLSPDSQHQQHSSHRPRISDEGPFKIITRPDGTALCVENTDWPPGVHYTKPNRFDGKQGLGDFYTKNGAVVAGGEGAANRGPDPDWIPGLSKEQKKKMNDEKSGNYVF